MARTGISFEDVRNAAESLLGRGLNPTIQRVREVLGTGSNTTISEHLKVWQQQLAEAPKIVLPPSVPEAVALALDTFWKIAVQQAETAFDEQRLRAEQKAASAEQARDAALAEQRQLEIEQQQLRRQLDTAQTTTRELADRLLVEQERRANAEIAIQTAEQQVEAATAASAQIRAETTARVSQLETVLQQARIDMEQQLIEANQRLVAEQQRCMETEARLTALLNQLQAEQATERQGWQHREEIWHEQNQVQLIENYQLKSHLATTKQQRDAAIADLEKSRLDLEGAKVSYLATVREAESLRGELKAVQAERDRLQQPSIVTASPSPSPLESAAPKKRSSPRKPKP